ncbi:hypothetical protein Q8G41_27715, partial [Klebsiella pneumoniae]|uniref:hypothetical protein n=1 Tax=Klebsiella pneumoniae TaxID=573 RepID=UPI0030132121
VNSIPVRVRLSVDVRDTNLQRRDAVMRAFDGACRTTSAKRKVAIDQQLLNADSPAECGTAIIVTLSQACKKHGFDFLRMTSRAYLDSLF